MTRKGGPHAAFLIRTLGMGTAGATDLDHDGGIDIDGSGVFTPAAPSTPISALGLTANPRCNVALVNGDDILDVLFVVPGAGTTICGILIGQGGGLFSAPTFEVMDVVSVADVDGDGDVDLVGSSLIALNRRFFGFYDGYRSQYGGGTGGTGGTVPVLGATGPIRAGETVTIRVTGTLGGTAGVLAVGVEMDDAPIFGSTLLVQPAAFVEFSTSGAPGAGGVGRWEISWTPPVWIAGLQFFHQAAVADPSGPSGLAFTNGLRLIYGD